MCAENQLRRKFTKIKKFAPQIFLSADLPVADRLTRIFADAPASGRLKTHSGYSQLKQITEDAPASVTGVT